MGVQWQALAMGATKCWAMINNEPRSVTILHINATNSTMEKMLRSYLIALQRIINKQGEDTKTLMKNNAKLKVVVIENQDLTQMVAILQVVIENECL